MIFFFAMYQSKLFYRITFRICFFLFTLTAAAPAQAIRLTYVKHLFDITHGFSEPSDVSVSKDGRIHVVDGVNNKIKIFSLAGKFVSAFGDQGQADGQFKYPLGIDIDDANRIYIADSGNRRVQIFEPGGKFIAKIDIPPKGGRPADPTDVAVDTTRNRCYVVDNDNHHLLVYDLAGLKRVNTYGAVGTGKAEFRYPFLMALGKDRNLYIVDVINTRVQVLNPDGAHITDIGGWGVERGEFFRPKGVALDSRNRVYVSDSHMGVIQVFESTGEFYAALGDPAYRRVKKFKTPVGIYIDSRNRLYVVEMFAQKVSVYQIEDPSAQ